jgi:hypothetical protein
VTPARLRPPWLVWAEVGEIDRCWHFILISNTSGRCKKDQNPTSGVRGRRLPLVAAGGSRVVNPFEPWSLFSALRQMDDIAANG